MGFTSGPWCRGKKRNKAISINFCPSKLEEVRETTKTEFAKKYDDWFMKFELFFEEKPTNNYCKWFHVCEHESNHRGQMKFIIIRLPYK